MHEQKSKDDIINNKTTDFFILFIPLRIKYIQGYIVLVRIYNPVIILEKHYNIWYIIMGICETE